jgi:anthranilate/para-aminobenzoate synthase component II
VLRMTATSTFNAVRVCDRASERISVTALGILDCLGLQTFGENFGNRVARRNLPADKRTSPNDETKRMK